MKAIELRNKSVDELRLLAGEKIARHEEAKFLVRQGKLKNVKELRALKKDIARINTLLRQSATRI